MKLPREYLTPRGRFLPAAVYHSGCSQNGWRCGGSCTLYLLQQLPTIQDDQQEHWQQCTTSSVWSGTVHRATAVRHLHSALTLLWQQSVAHSVPGAGWQDGSSKGAGDTESRGDMVTWGAPYLRWLHLMNVQWEINSPLSLLHLEQPGQGRNSAGQCKHHQVLGALAALWEAPPTPSCQAPCAWYCRGHTQPVQGCRLDYLKAIQALKFIKSLSLLSDTNKFHSVFLPFLFKRLWIGFFSNMSLFTSKLMLRQSLCPQLTPRLWLQWSSLAFLTMPLDLCYKYCAYRLNALTWLYITLF